MTQASANKRVAWILGAGASKEAGYPLVGDFLSEAYLDEQAKRHVLVGLPKLPIRRFLGEVDALSAIDRDLNQLMSRALESGEAALLTRINGLVHNQIAMARWFTSDFWGLPYLECFASILAATDSFVISFNYDTLVEEHLGMRAVLGHRGADGYLHFGDEGPAGVIDYRLTPDELRNWRQGGAYMDFGAGFVPSAHRNGDGVHLYKLHGSVDWWYCADCRQSVYAPEEQSNIPGLALRYTTASAWDCPYCGAGQAMQAFFVPPASDRSFPAWDVVDVLWERAEEELRTADAIVVAGYSFPDDDERAHAMLQHVMAGRDIPLLVADPYPTERLLARVAAISDQACVVSVGFTELIRCVVRQRLGLSVPVARELPTAARVLELIASPDVARPGGPLYFAPDWTKDLTLQLDHDTSSAGRVRNQGVQGLLGMSGAETAYDALIDYAQSAPDFLACSALGAICAGDNESALEAIDPWIRDTSRVMRQEIVNPMQGLVPGGRPVGAVVIDALAALVLRGPPLDYGDAVFELVCLLVDPPPALSAQRRFVGRLLLTGDLLRRFRIAECPFLPTTLTAADVAAALDIDLQVFAQARLAVRIEAEADRQAGSTGPRKEDEPAWRSPEGRALSVLREVRGGSDDAQPPALALSPDGRRVCTSHWDRVSVRDVQADGTAWCAAPSPLLAGVGEAREAALAPASVAWSRDGATIAAAGAGRHVLLFDAADGAIVAQWRAHVGEIRDLAWSPDGRFLATASADAEARIWSIDEPESPKAVLCGHWDQVTCLSWHPAGRYLATGSWDTNAQVWDVHAERIELSIEICRFSVMAVRWSPDGRHLGVASAGEEASIWRVARNQRVTSFDAHGGRLWDLRWSPSGELVSTTSDDGTLRVWSPLSGEELARFGSGTPAFFGSREDAFGRHDWSPDGRVIVCGRGGDLVTVLDASAFA